MIQQFGHGRQRRLEIQRDLARLPPPPSRGGFPRRVWVDGEERRAARAWRGALAEMGPLFAACGNYLSSRGDVFPPGFRRELATLATDASAAPLPVAQARLARELGGAPERLLTRLAGKSWETRLLFQTCHTRLRNGAPVTVKLVRPEFDEYPVEEDFDLLRLLAPGLAPWAERHGDLKEVEEVLATAQATLEAEVNLEWEAEALAGLANCQAAESRVLRVYDELSTNRLLIMERPETTRLVDLPAGAKRDDLAFRLCLGWLRHVLMGCCYPRLPAAENVDVSAEGQIVFRDVSFARSLPSWQDQFWQYLAAAAAHDPDLTCSALVAMASSSAGEERVLQYHLRQLQPLRDAEGPVCRDELGEHLLLHWKLAARLGFRPRPALVDFFRGLGALQGVLRCLAPGYDTLLAAFEQLRLDAEVGRWHQRLDPERLGQDLQSCVALLTQLPQKFDSALAATESGLRLRLETSDPGLERRRDSPLLEAVALFVVALLAVALFAVSLVASSFGEELAALPVLEKLAAIVLVLVSGLLLKKLVGT